MTATGIEWTEATWNPVTGCTKVSPGCKHCYAERMAGRLQAMGAAAYRNGFELTLRPQKLDVPLRWRRPQTIFVNSMSDLFHEDVPTAYVRRVFDVMRRASWHRFQVLTKRAERLAELDAELVWAPNIWMGVSVESAAYAWRIDRLRRTRAGVRFLSLEPLLGPLEGLDLSGIHWVIVGGESGPGARPMEAPWARSVRNQCLRAGVPFFFKQWGGLNKKRAGRAIDGRTWDEMPDVHGVDRGDNAGVDGRRERDELAVAMNTAEHVAARESGLRSTDGIRPGKGASRISAEPWPACLSRRVARWCSDARSASVRGQWRPLRPRRQA